MCNLLTLPNILTLCNLLCGAAACKFAFEADYKFAFIFIICGAIFDFFDGFAARLTHQSSPIGKELDSLADDITFGLAPSAMVYSLLVQLCTTLSGGCFSILPFAAFIMAAFSALRLAKFNLDERQTSGFLGLPTPANSLFWGALIVCFSEQIPATGLSIGLIITGVIISSLLLVCELPMFALKFKSFGWKDNQVRYSFLLSSAILILVFRLEAFCYIIVLYVLVSIVQSLFRGR